MTNYKENGKASKKKLLISAALLLSLITIWLIATPFLAQNAANSGTYRKAIRLWQANPFTVDKGCEYALAIGDQLLTAARYEEAIFCYLNAGTIGEESYFSACAQYGKYLYETEGYDHATTWFEKAGTAGWEIWADTIEDCYLKNYLTNFTFANRCLADMPELPDKNERIYRIYFNLATEHFKQLGADWAIDLLSKVSQCGEPNLIAELDAYCFQMGTEQLNTALLRDSSEFFACDQYREAMSILELGSKGSDAHTLYAFMEDLQREDLIEMVPRLAECHEQGFSDIDWLQVLDATLNSRGHSIQNLNHYLTIYGIVNRLNTPETLTPDELKARFAAVVVRNDGAFASPNGNTLVGCATYDAIAMKCSGANTGKILIMRESAPYEGDPLWMIDFGLMSCLNQEQYPHAFSEVEYIVVIKYSYSVHGEYYYSFGGLSSKTEIEAVQEYADLSCYRMDNKHSNIWQPISISGSIPPKQAASRNTPYISGGVPMIQSYLAYLLTNSLP